MSSGLAPLSVKSISKSNQHHGICKDTGAGSVAPCCSARWNYKKLLARLNNVNDIIAITVRGYASVQSYYEISRRPGI